MASSRRPHSGSVGTVVTATEGRKPERRNSGPAKPLVTTGELNTPVDVFIANRITVLSPKLEINTLAPFGSTVTPVLLTPPANGEPATAAKDAPAPIVYTKTPPAEALFVTRRKFPFGEMAKPRGRVPAP